MQLVSSLTCSKPTVGAVNGARGCTRADSIRREDSRVRRCVPHPRAPDHTLCMFALRHQISLVPVLGTAYVPVRNLPESVLSVHPPPP